MTQQQSSSYFQCDKLGWLTAKNSYIMLGMACFAFLIKKKKLSPVTGGVPSLAKHTQSTRADKIKFNSRIGVADNSLLSWETPKTWSHSLWYGLDSIAVRSFKKCVAHLIVTVLDIFLNKGFTINSLFSYRFKCSIRHFNV